MSCIVLGKRHDGKRIHSGILIYPTSPERVKEVCECGVRTLIEEHGHIIEAALHYHHLSGEWRSIPLETNLIALHEQLEAHAAEYYQTIMTEDATHADPAA